MAAPRWVERRFDPADLEAIARSVADAESGTSAEIRVHLERRVPRARFGRSLAPLTRAREVFAHLGMHRTRHRNGVLVYLAVDDRKLAIVGDEGIHARVGDEYWTRVRDLMVAHLRRGASRTAIVEAVEELGRALAAHFPRGRDDVDELPDGVSTD